MKHPATTVRSEFANRPVHQIYLLSLVASALVFTLLIYIASEYFKSAQFSQLVSFKAADGPGPLPQNLYPQPLGEHFFGDFLIPFRLAQQPSPYLAPGFLPFSYFPLSSVLLAPFIAFDYWPALVMFLVIGVGLVLLAVLRLQRYTGGQVHTSTLLAITFLSGPMLSVLDRGNLSLLLLGSCVLATAELKHGRNVSSAVFFGLAAAMKAYPILFLTVFVKRRDWKSLAAGFSTFMMGTLIPLTFYEGGLVTNFREMSRQFVASGTTEHASKVRAYNNSFFAFFDSAGLAGDWFRANYTLLFGLIALALVGMSVRKCATDFETLLICSVVMVFSPQTVGQYVLLLLLVPILWLVTDRQVASWPARVSAVLLGILMVPKGLPLTGPQAEWSPASRTFTSVLNPFLALTLLTLSVITITVRRQEMNDARTKCD